nr:hypothetical protein CFP56_56741 [Quercus suber]
MFISDSVVHLAITVIMLLKKFQVPHLQLVIAAVPYAKIRFSRLTSDRVLGYSSYAICSNPASRLISDRVVHLAIIVIMFLKKFQVPHLQLVIAALPYAKILSRGYKGRVVCSNPISRLISNLVIDLAITVIMFLEKFQVPHLQWVKGAMAYANILSRVSYRGRAVCPNLVSRLICDRVICLAITFTEFLKKFQVPDLLWVIVAVLMPTTYLELVIAAVLYAHILSQGQLATACVERLAIIVFKFLRKFLVPDLQWVIAAMLYAHILPQVGYSSPVVRSHPISRLISDRLVRFAIKVLKFLKNFQVPDLQWVITAVLYANIIS